MTTDIAIPFASYTVSGIGPYTLGWPYQANEVTVFAQEAGAAPVALAPTIDWAITPEASDVGGALLLSPAAALAHAGRRLLIQRQTTREQGFAGQSAREVGLEANMDRLMRSVQDIDAKLRSVPVFPGSVIAAGAVAEGRGLLFSGGAFVPGATEAEIASAADAAVAAASAAADATAAAAAAEAAASVLTGFAIPDWGTFTTDSALTNGRGPYALPYDPIAVEYVDLTVGGVPQVPGVGKDFTLTYSGSVAQILLASDWPSGVICDFRLQRPIAYDPNIRYLTPEQYGATGRGAGDDGPAFSAALTAANGIPVVGTAGAVYRVATPISFIGDVKLDLSMSRVLVPANITPFSFTAPAVGPFALGANYDLAGSPLAISTALLPFVPQAGQVAWIASRARDPGDRDNGSDSQQYRTGEAFRIGVGSTATSLILQAPLAHSEGIDPVSTAGDEARIPAYTIALDARIALPDMDAQCVVKLPVIEYEDGHDADGWSATGVSVTGYVTPLIQSGGVRRGYGPAVRLWGTYGATIDGLSVSNLTDDTPNGQFGYGVADGGWNTRVLGLTSHNVRHAYTTSKSTSSYTVGTFDAYKVLTFGRTAGAQIVGGIASGGISAAWDAHHDAQDILFSGNTSDGCGSAGYSIRGRNISIVNPVIRNCNEGIRYFTEYDSGDPDDDIYNNGKLLSDFTSGLIDSPQMDVRDNCLDVRAATVVLSGAGRYRSQSSCLIYNAGGTLAVGGTHRFVVEGARVPADGTALIDLGANNAFSASAFPEPNIVIDGVVEIDARLWTGAALTAISTDGGTKVIVRGILRLLMPAGSVFMSGGGTIICEGAGEIQWSSAGTPGLPAGISGLVVRVVADDGAIYDGVNQSTFFGATERVRPTGNGVTFFANGGGIRIEDTATSVSNAEDAGSIVFGTNDASNPAFDAAQILARGNGSLGYTDTAFRRNNGGGLRDALVVRSNGDVSFLRDDGTTIGAEWDASTGLLMLAGKPVLVTPGVFAGANDSARIQAMFDYCRDNGARWRMDGSYTLTDPVTCYSAGDGSGATLACTASGQAGPDFIIAPLAADEVLADATLLVAVQAIVSAGGWVRGVQTLPSLGAYAGQAIRVASTAQYLIRYSGTGYRYETFIMVADAEGNLSHPIAFSIPSSVTLSATDRQVIKPSFEIAMPNILVSSGAVDRPGSVTECSRPNTVLRGGSVRNTTAEEIGILLNINAFSGVIVRGWEGQGTKENATNYGIAHRGVGHRFENCLIRDCRRDIDGTYATHTVVSGGSYPDGVGGHFTVGLTITGASVGCDSPNTAPVFLTGGDVVVDNCTVTRPGAGGIIHQRSDGAELIGTVALRNSRVVFDLTGTIGTVDCATVQLSSPAVAHDFGRDTAFPSLIDQSGNLIETIGTGMTPRLSMFTVGTTRNATRLIVLDTDFFWSRNHIRLGAAGTVYLSGLRQTNWSGAGIRFVIEDTPGFTCYWGAAAGHADPLAARAYWTGRNLGAVTSFRTDYQATHRYSIACDSFTRSAAAGLTSLVGDEEWWHAVKGGAPQFAVPTLADDTAVAIAPGALFGAFMLAQLNTAGSAPAAQFITDVSGTDGVTFAWSVNATFAAYGTVLTGTTGTDGQINIGADSTTGKIYIENRTGASLAGVALLKVS